MSKIFSSIKKLAKGLAEKVSGMEWPKAPDWHPLLPPAPPRPDGNCAKCSASFWDNDPDFGPRLQYANDREHGERLICSCWRCGYRWFEPVVKDNEPTAPDKVNHLSI